MSYHVIDSDSDRFRSATVVWFHRLTLPCRTHCFFGSPERRFCVRVAVASRTPGERPGGAASQRGDASRNGRRPHLFWYVYWEEMALPWGVHQRLLWIRSPFANSPEKSGVARRAAGCRSFFRPSVGGQSASKVSALENDTVLTFSRLHNPLYDFVAVPCDEVFPFALVKCRFFPDLKTILHKKN